MIKFSNLAIGELFLLKVILAYLLLKFWSISIAIAWLCLAFGMDIWNMNQARTYWSKKGVPGPPQHILFGNTKQVAAKGFMASDLENTKIYGPNYGTQLLGTQYLIISDLETIRQVVIKDFSHFINRRAISTGNCCKTRFLYTAAGFFYSKICSNKNRGLVDNKYNVLAHAMVNLRDERWKDVRGTVTPAFTTGKIKKMFPIMQSSIQILSQKLQKCAEDSTWFDAKTFFGGFAVDVIAKSAFGIDVDAQNADDSVFVQMASKLILYRVAGPVAMFGAAFSNLIRLWQNFTKKQLFNNDVYEFFCDTVRKAIMEREREPKNAKADFLQSLLNILKSNDNGETDEKVEPVDNEISHAAIRSKKVRLDELEIIAQSFLFLVAGYETTNTTLQFIAYEMAMNPDIQEQCHRQINDVLGDKENIDYDDLMKMPLLEQVMLETLRVYPPVSRFDRECKVPTTINGIRLDVDDCVAIAVSVVHQNPEIYPEPENFSPELKASRDPLAFLAFGAGPRNCIGMRFTQLEIRLVMAYLLKQYKFIPNDKTPEKPLRLVTPGFTKPVDPIILSVIKRK